MVRPEQHVSHSQHCTRPEHIRQTHGCSQSSPTQGLLPQATLQGMHMAPTHAESTFTGRRPEQPTSSTAGSSRMPCLPTSLRLSRFIWPPNSKVTASLRVQEPGRPQGSAYLTLPAPRSQNCQWPAVQGVPARLTLCSVTNHRHSDCPR